MTCGELNLQRKMEIGDVVLIKLFGGSYSSYFSKFKEMGFRLTDNDEYIKNYYQNLGALSLKDKSKRYTIFSKGKHDTDSIVLYGIEDAQGNQFLFNEDALKIDTGYLRDKYIDKLLNESNS